MKLDILNLLGVGEIEFLPYLVVNDEKVLANDVKTTVTDELIHLHLTYDNNATDDIYFSKVNDQDGILVKRRFVFIPL